MIIRYKVNSIMLEDPETVKYIMERLRELNPEQLPKYNYNLKKLLAYQKEWRSKNPRKEKAKRDRYYSKPKSKELAKMRANKRRLLKLGLSTSHTIKEWEEKKKEFGYSCAYCGKYALCLTKDHIIPLTKGGTDSIENIVPACEHFNKSKGIKDVSDFEFKGTQRALIIEDRNE